MHAPCEADRPAVPRVQFLPAFPQLCSDLCIRLPLQGLFGLLRHGARDNAALFGEKKAQKFNISNCL